VRTIGLLALLWARSASGYTYGISGASGKQGPNCNGCHRGGATPNVTLTGPMQLHSNDTATYQLTVESTSPAQAQAGLDVAASAGALAVHPGASGTWVVNGEITHTAPAAGTTVTFTFDFIAPSYGTAVTLYGAGNSVDGDGTVLGDQAATATLAVTVIGPPPDLLPPPPDLSTPDLAPPPDSSTARDFGAPPAPRSSGCACTVAAASAPSPLAPLFWLSLFSFVLILRIRAR
jgi:MYXO-CTERM domain-containing protein